MDGYPKAENRVIRVARNQMNFLIVKMLVWLRQVSNAYGLDKKLEFVDLKNDTVLVENQDTLVYAMHQSLWQEVEKYVQQLKAMKQPVPDPIKLPSVEIRLLVSGTRFPPQQISLTNGNLSL